MSKRKERAVLKAANGYDVSLPVTRRAIKSFLECLDCPRSLAVWLLYESGEHEQLVDLDFSVDCYASPGHARDAYVATQFLLKADFLGLNRDPKSVAITGFFNSEAQCEATNKRFSDLSKDPSFKGPCVWLLNAAKRKIAEILGEPSGPSLATDSSFDAQEWFDSCSWGPGSTTLTTGELTGPENKFRVEHGMTSDLYSLVGPLFGHQYPAWNSELKLRFPCWGLPIELLPEGSISFEVGNKVLTVPKNAKTERVIAAEPGLNLWFQLGIGRMISRRLLRNAGIDLRTQDRNQLLAFYASYTGKLATIDFSSASDTISISVVRELFPPLWYSVMDSSRSHYGRNPSSPETFLKYQKFSSMGNGFTFPLQTLIFTTAAIVVCEYLGIDSSYVGVFGDDVVLPSDCFELFQEFCNFLGFTIGTKKSFSKGFFRESCGAHYFLGVDLKPIYLRSRLKKLEDMYVFANAIRRLALRFIRLGCDRRLRPAWAYIVRQIPSVLRFRIPDGYGDGGLVGNFDEASPSTVRKPEGLWIEGYEVMMMGQASVKVVRTDAGLKLARLFDVDRRHNAYIVETPWSAGRNKPAGNNVSLRRASKRTLNRTLVHDWKDIGAWF